MPGSFAIANAMEPAAPAAPAAAPVGQSPLDASDARTAKAMDKLIALASGGFAASAAARSLLGLNEWLHRPSVKDKARLPRRSVIELPYYAGASKTANTPPMTPDEVWELPLLLADATRKHMALGGVLGAGLGGINAPSGRRREGTVRGALAGAGTGVGAGIGGAAGGALANAMMAPHPSEGPMLLGLLGGAGLGGVGAHVLAQKLLGPSSWDREREKQGTDKSAYRPFIPRPGRNINPANSMERLNAGPALSKEMPMTSLATGGAAPTGPSPFQANINRNMALNRGEKVGPRRPAAPTPPPQPSLGNAGFGSVAPLPTTGQAGQSGAARLLGNMASRSSIGSGAMSEGPQGADFSYANAGRKPLPGPGAGQPRSPLSAPAPASSNGPAGQVGVNKIPSRAPFQESASSLADEVRPSSSSPRMPSSADLMFSRGTNAREDPSIRRPQPTGLTSGSTPQSMYYPALPYRAYKPQGGFDLPGAKQPDLPASPFAPAPTAPAATRGPAPSAPTAPTPPPAVSAVTPQSANPLAALQTQRNGQLNRNLMYPGSELPGPERNTGNVPWQDVATGMMGGLKDRAVNTSKIVGSALSPSNLPRPGTMMGASQGQFAHGPMPIPGPPASQRFTKSLENPNMGGRFQEAMRANPLPPGFKPGVGEPVTGAAAFHPPDMPMQPFADGMPGPEPTGLPDSVFGPQAGLLQRPPGVKGISDRFAPGEMKMGNYPGCSGYKPKKKKKALMKKGEPNDPSALAQGLVSALGLTRGGQPDSGFTGLLKSHLNPPEATDLTHMPWVAGLGLPAAGAGIYAGWKPMDMLFKHLRKTDEESELEEAKKQYEEELRQQALAKAGEANLDTAYDNFEKTALIEPWEGLLAALFTGTALGGGGWAYQQAAKSNSNKVMEEALKQRQRELYTRTPRPFVVKPVPVYKNEVGEQEEDQDEKERLGVPAPAPDLQGSLR